MQKRVLTTIVLALVSLGILTAQSKNTEQFFHRVGNEIIHPNGEHFQIKGANVSCWLYQENYVLGGAQTAQKVTAEKISKLIGKKAYLEYIKKMTDSFLLEEDIKLMKRMGVNCVRLGFDAVLFESDSTKNWFFKSIDRLLPAFRAYDISILPTLMVPPRPPDKLWCTGYVKGDIMLWDSPDAKKER